LELQAPPVDRVNQLELARLSSPLPGIEIIQPGDVLDILVVADHRDRNVRPWPIRVSESGAVYLPLIGAVNVAGLELHPAERAIAAAAIERGIYRSPLVTVTMNKPRTTRVTVIGAVKKEGVYELPRGQNTLLHALVMAGNLSDDADEYVEIRRIDSSQLDGSQVANYFSHSIAETTAAAYHRDSSPRVQTISLRLQGGGSEVPAQSVLQDGDIVIVPRRSPRSVYVLGLVNRPGKVDLPWDRDLHLLEALAMAGGRSSELADKVQIIRQRPNSNESVVILASVRQAKAQPGANLRLAPGDVVSVEETPVTMADRLLRQFLRVGVSATMPVF